MEETTKREQTLTPEQVDTALVRNVAQRRALLDKLEKLEGIARRYEDEADRRKWPRVYLVNEPDGLVHSSTECPDCDTENCEVYLVPRYSGKPTREVVRDAGERACLRCYPKAKGVGESTEALTPRCVVEAEIAAERESLRRREEEDKKLIDPDTGKPFEHDGKEYRTVEGVRRDARKSLRQLLLDLNEAQEDQPPEERLEFARRFALASSVRHRLVWMDENDIYDMAQKIFHNLYVSAMRQQHGEADRPPRPSFQGISYWSREEHDRHYRHGHPKNSRESRRTSDDAARTEAQENVR